MIQDIAPHKLYNQFRKDCVPDAGSPVLIFSGNRLEYIKAFVKDGRFSYPVYSQMPEGIRYIYLFSIDRDQYFLGIGPVSRILRSGISDPDSIWGMRTVI